jgi:hypothetical protein
MSRKYLIIGAIALGKAAIGGQLGKNQQIIEYLKNHNKKFYIIDTFNWKRKLPIIIFKILYELLTKKKKDIILSSSANSANFFLKVAYYLNIHNHPIFFFVIGGVLADKLQSKKYKIKYYQNVEGIFPESIQMVNNLNCHQG